VESDKPFELKQVKVRLRLTEGESLYSGRPLTTPQAATDVMAKVLAEMDREYCCIVMLDNKLRALAYNVVSIGSINQSIVPMSNIFKAAVLTNASALLAMHNHPSGIADCSLEDMKMTKQLVKAGKLMGIPLVDHIIIGAGDHQRFSFRDADPKLFEGTPAYDTGKPTINYYNIGETIESESIRRDQASKLVENAPKEFSLDDKPKKPLRAKRTTKRQSVRKKLSDMENSKMKATEPALPSKTQIQKKNLVAEI